MNFLCTILGIFVDQCTLILLNVLKFKHFTYHLKICSVLFGYHHITIAAINSSNHHYFSQEHGEEEVKKWRLVRVDDNFRVIALGLPVPRYSGQPLDPPLRSRFQARDVATVGYGVSIFTKIAFFLSKKLQYSTKVLTAMTNSCDYSM